MALGKRKSERQAHLFLQADHLPRSPGHVFYEKLHGLLAEAGFDPWLDLTCRLTGERPPLPFLRHRLACRVSKMLHNPSSGGGDEPLRDGRTGPRSPGGADELTAPRSTPAEIGGA